VKLLQTRESKLIMEWVLILTMHIIKPSGHLPEVQMEMIDGFSSESACNKAGNTLSMTLLNQVNKHVKQQGVVKGNKHNLPSVFIECSRIDK